jgi:hypothetical protein
MLGFSTIHVFGSNIEHFFRVIHRDACITTWIVACGFRVGYRISVVISGAPIHWKSLIVIAHRLTEERQKRKKGKVCRSDY